MSKRSSCLEFEQSEFGGFEFGQTSFNQLRSLRSVNDVIVGGGFGTGDVGFKVGDGVPVLFLWHPTTLAMLHVMCFVSPQALS